MVDRIFVSDTHLEHEQSAAFVGFARLIRSAAEQGCEVYLLGDIVEMWIGDDDDAPFANALKRLLAEAARQTPVYLMHGNRDFLFGPQFEAETGVQLLSDPHLLSDGVLVAHGDAYCTDDEAYQQFRALARSAQWQADILGRTLEERRAFGAALRDESKRTNANKAANIMDVNAEAVSQALTEHRALVLVHGHTHRPGEHVAEQRIVLGAWERVGWYVEQTGKRFQLRCINLADRYESETSDPA